jgi:hypothetical protein
MPGRLTFSTTASGSSTPTERMRIDSKGAVGIGATPNVASKLQIADTISDATLYSGYWQVNASNPSGSGPCIGLSMLMVPTASWGSSGGVVAFSGSATNQSTGTIPTLRGFSSGLTSTGGGTVTDRQAFIDTGLTLTSGSVTNNYSFTASSIAVGATNNFGFFGNLAAATGRWNFYANGTAQNYFAGNTTLNAALHQTPTRSTVASGSTITLTTSTNHLLYDNAATAASLTVTLPSASLTDGQVITIATRSAITSLTVNGGTIYGNPTTLAAGGFASFIYSSGASAWFRKG